MKKVLALIGESGSGKSAIAEELRNQGYYVIDSYTTREPRSENETGHIFSSIGIYSVQFRNGLVVADTIYNKNLYWTSIDQFREGWNIYVIDPIGIEQLYRDNRLETTGVYIRTEEKERYTRMYKSRVHAAAKERIDHDKEAFKFIHCDYVVDNNGKLEDAVRRILRIMEV